MRSDDKVARTTSPDAILVLRCQAGDDQAFDEIVSLYKDGVYNYTWRMISNREDAEDLTQETFVRAFAAIKSFRRESNLRTWLYRIATNLCVDRYRRAGLEKQLLAPFEQKQREEDGEPVTIEFPDTTHDPRRVYERTELHAEIQKALSRLPQKLRSAVLLFDLEGMSYEEIAVAVGCPLGTVKSRIFHGRLQLRGMLRQYAEYKG